MQAATHSPVMAHTVMPAGIQQRSHTRPNAFGLLLYIGLMLCVFLDINRFSLVLLNARNRFSLIYLLLCILIFFAFRFRVFHSMGRVGKAYFAFLVIYFAVSIPMRLTDFSDVTVYIVAYRVRTILASVLFLLASALGAYHLFRAFDTRKAMWVLVLCSATMPIGMGMVWAAGGLYSGDMTADWDINSTQMEAQRLEVAGRNAGLFGDPNQAGMFLSSGAALAFACLSVCRTNQERLLLFAIIIAFALCVISTYSRSAMLTFLLMVGVQTSLSRVIRSKATFLIGGAGLAALIWFMLAGYQNLNMTSEQQRRMADFTELLQGNISSKTTGHRLEVAARGIEAWKDSPILGVGIGRGAEANPHNEFVRILVDAGIVGCFAFVFLFLRMGFSALYCHDDAIRNLVIGYLTVFFCSCMTLGVNLTDNVPAIMLGVCFASLAAARDKQKLHRSSRARPVGAEALALGV